MKQKRKRTVLPQNRTETQRPKFARERSSRCSEEVVLATDGDSGEDGDDEEPLFTKSKKGSISWNNGPTEGTE